MATRTVTGNPVRSKKGDRRSEVPVDLGHRGAAYGGVIPLGIASSRVEG